VLYVIKSSERCPLVVLIGHPTCTRRMSVVGGKEDSLFM